MSMPAESATTDESLVQSVLQGNQQAFRIMVLRYQNLVTHIVFRMVKQAQDREDLCQEIFLKAYDKLDGFRFGSKLSTWIGSIAFNTCINFLRKKKLVLVDGDKNDEDDQASLADMRRDTAPRPDELLANKERNRLLWKYVDELPPVQQTIISLFHKQELQMDEIATIMNMPLGTVKSYLHRARQSLRNKLSA
ncbi:MAG TPA: sigma-70 family RNA polymerase sigma factor [Chitinophagaceae bacterium]|nr:sigma-70 family RNA polymerase sigma factor [Chitinophagaceae bacterium]